MYSGLKFFVVAFVLLSGVIGAAGESGAAEAARQTFLLGRNQIYQSRYYVFDSGQPGPRVLVHAGIHGDEVAGVYALEEMAPRIKVQSGMLILVPRVNTPAILTNRRAFHLDLNQIFPGLPRADRYEYALAYELYEMAKNRRVEYVLALHESRNMHNPGRAKTFGQTVVYGKEPPPRLIWTWLQAMNKELDYDEKFCHYFCPQEYGATDIMVRQLKLKGGFAVETWRRFDLLRRVEMQKLAVLTFLEQVGMEYDF